jgi:hypothetical protein
MASWIGRGGPVFGTVFHPQFLSCTTHRGIYGMLWQKESHWLHERRHLCSPADDPSAYMKAGWIIGRDCDQMAIAYVQRDVAHFLRGIPGTILCVVLFFSSLTFYSLLRTATS